MYSAVRFCSRGLSGTLPGMNSFFPSLYSGPVNQGYTMTTRIQESQLCWAPCHTPYSQRSNSALFYSERTMQRATVQRYKRRKGIQSLSLVSYALRPLRFKSQREHRLRFQLDMRVRFLNRARIPSDLIARWRRKRTRFRDRIRSNSGDASDSKASFAFHFKVVRLKWPHSLWKRKRGFSLTVFPCFRNR